MLRAWTVPCVSSWHVLEETTSLVAIAPDLFLERVEAGEALLAAHARDDVDGEPPARRGRCRRAGRGRGPRRAARAGRRGSGGRRCSSPPRHRRDPTRGVIARSLARSRPRSAAEAAPPGSSSARAAYTPCAGSISAMCGQVGRGKPERPTARVSVDDDRRQTAADAPAPAPPRPRHPRAIAARTRVLEKAPAASATTACDSPRKPSLAPRALEQRHVPCPLRAEAEISAHHHLRGIELAHQQLRRRSAPATSWPARRRSGTRAAGPPRAAPSAARDRRAGRAPAAACARAPAPGAARRSAPPGPARARAPRPRPASAPRRDRGARRRSSRSPATSSGARRGGDRSGRLEGQGLDTRAHGFCRHSGGIGAVCEQNCRPDVPVAAVISTTARIPCDRSTPRPFPEQVAGSTLPLTVAFRRRAAARLVRRGPGLPARGGDVDGVAPGRQAAALHLAHQPVARRR